jgi:hypothetical protein
MATIFCPKGNKKISIAIGHHPNKGVRQKISITMGHHPKKDSVLYPARRTLAVDD